MKNSELFEALRRTYELFSTARGIDTEQMLVMVQSAKGDSEYPMTVAVAFKHLAGDNWDKYCNIYDTSKKNEQLSEEQERACRSELKTFWRHVKRSKYYGEFLSTAAWYLRIKEAA